MIEFSVSEARLPETIEELAMEISMLNGQTRRVEKMMKRLEAARANTNLSANKRAVAERAMRGCNSFLSNE